MRYSKKEIKNLKKNKKRIKELNNKAELTPKEKKELDNLNFIVTSLLNAIEILSDREKEFIQMRIDGLTFIEIASLKYLSSTGAEYVVSVAQEKLDKILNYR